MAELDEMLNDPIAGRQLSEAMRRLRNGQPITVAVQWRGKSAKVRLTPMVKRNGTLVEPPTYRGQGDG